MTKEALEICKKCREKQKEKYPQSVNCAFLHDDMYCDRLEDINALIEKLLERSKEYDRRKTS